MVRKSMYSIIACAAIIAFISFRCTKDKAQLQPLTPGIVDTVSFQQKILPLMTTSCGTSGCHDTGTKSSGKEYTDYGTISANATDGLSAMKGINGKTQMPLGQDKLADSLIGQFEAWIAQGKLNN